MKMGVDGLFYYYFFFEYPTLDLEKENFMKRGDNLDITITRLLI